MGINSWLQVFIWDVLIFLVEILNSGDTFSGTAKFESCLDVTDPPTALVISEAKGNIFRGKMVTRVRSQVVYKEVKGFFYTPKKQLVVVPANPSAGTLSMVCEHKENSGSAAECSIMTDSFTRTCGSISLQRDRTSKFGVKP